MPNPDNDVHLRGFMARAPRANNARTCGWITVKVPTPKSAAYVEMTCFQENMDLALTLSEGDGVSVRGHLDTWKPNGEKYAKLQMIVDELTETDQHEAPRPRRQPGPPVREDSHTPPRETNATLPIDDMEIPF